MKRKFIPMGFLFGVIVGVLLTFIFPDLLILSLKYNVEVNKELGFPQNYFSHKDGSILGSSLMIIPFVTGIFGALIGYVLFRLRRK